MSAATVLALAVLGGAGAVARVALDAAVAARAGRAFPFGTLAVNVVGSLALGVLAGAAVAGYAYDLVATGLLGSLTTFSTWMWETRGLVAHERSRLAAANVAVSLVLGLAAVCAGRQLGIVL